MNRRELLSRVAVAPLAAVALIKPKPSHEFGTVEQLRNTIYEEMRMRSSNGIPPNEIYLPRDVFPCLTRMEFVAPTPEGLEGRPVHYCDGWKVWVPVRRHDYADTLLHWRKP